MHLATTTAKALALLDTQPMDLAVVDLQMPVMDGLQFLALLNRKYPTLRKVVLTGFATSDHRSQCLNGGAELFLEKPRTSEGYETVFATLRELASLPAQEGFRGMLRAVGLPDLIQMECLGRNSSILEVSNPQVRGRIYIEKGAVIHAAVGPVTGEAAFNQLLCLRGGEFHLHPFAAPPERSIDAQYEFLLMEAARMRDELAECLTAAEPPPAEAGPPAPAARTRPPDAAPSEPATRIEELVVCSGQGDVLYEWHCGDVEARLKLFHLITLKAEQLGRLLPLGRLDRLEAVSPPGRMVAHLAPDQKLFVRASREPTTASRMAAPE